MKNYEAKIKIGVLELALLCLDVYLWAFVVLPMYLGV